MSTRDAVCVATEVAVDPATAFEVFTEDIDAWWGDALRPGSGPFVERAGVLRFEPEGSVPEGECRRLLEVFDDAAAFEKLIGDWWQGLLAALRTRASRRARRA